MGAAASIVEDKLPDDFSEEICRELTGKCFDERLFNFNAANAVISKSKLAQIIAARTDCFLTHDWGNELGQDNHARVGCVNTALQKRGLKTWFDAEQMQGNIKKQMIAGIDNSQCIVVFITLRYILKVAGQNAEDNCQLEFNYASRTKTATRMVAVVMEERVRNTSMWQGEVGMVLGGSLYVDMCGDLSNEEYLTAKADELEKAILRVIGTPVANFGWLAEALKPSGNTSAAPSDVRNPENFIAGEVRPLESLSVEEVGSLLQSLSLSNYAQELANNAIDGKCLAACESVDDVKEMGVAMKVKAKLLYNFIETARSAGVSSEILQIGQAQPASSVSADDQTDPVPEMDPLTQLIQELKDGTSNAKEQAAVAVMNLAVASAQNRESIAAAGAIPALVQLLSDENPCVQKQAAAALKWLAVNDQNKTAIAAAGAIPLLVLLLQNGTDDAKEQAVEAFVQLAVDSENRRIIAEGGAIPLLVQLLKDGSPSTQQQALGALKWLAVDAENKKLVAAAGAIPLLVQLLEAGVSAVAQEQAADALKQLAVDPENKKLIADAGAIPLLLQLRQDGSPGAQEQAVNVLQQLGVGA